ncbi:MAG TPA: phosphate ABC transporter permease PstA [Chthoniobacteraceae bacterium]|jgi:phosphate transport system permease protein
MHASVKSFDPRAQTRTPGEPLVWLCSIGLSLGLLMVVGLLSVIVVNGLSVFWARPVAQITFAEGNPASFMGAKSIAGEVTKQREKIIPDVEVREAMLARGERPTEWQMFVANKDVYGLNFLYVDRQSVAAVTWPRDIMRIERTEYGDVIGFPTALTLQDGTTVPSTDMAFYGKLQALSKEAGERRHEIMRIERGEIGKINASMQNLRLDQKAAGEGTAEFQRIEGEIAELQKQYETLATKAGALRQRQGENQFTYRLATGHEQTIPVGQVVGFYYPNQLGWTQRLGLLFQRGWNFLTEEPREANTEGGIFPAIFGTCVMTLLMSILVTPFGVLAAIYLREYARQGFFVRAVRIAVNNLAGVPSIVFGVFGLGFFVYFVGGTIDSLFFQRTLPTPTFGTGGILWAALTLSLMTVPVVIVATEEALSAVTRGQREGSLACGASKWQTIQHIVLPSAVPGILTGLILAMARGAGEVAPLMLVGVVKLAPSLPLDTIWPFVHLERKFMHLGFHIYDLGFQSPDSEAAKPMVFATTLLLIVLVVMLNLGAIILRERIRRRYRTGAF